jgi:hypothetical protein
MDVFLSYASEDRLKAATLAKLFDETGWTVWWDQVIEGGKRWEPAVLDEARAARCVVVLWSRDSRKKDWVQKEAAIGREQGTLVPVLMLPSSLPTPTPDVQGVRLSTWNGGETADLLPLLRAVRAKVGRGEVPELPTPEVDARLARYSEQISRVEVAQAVFDYCALQLEAELKRRAGHAFSEDDLKQIRVHFDRVGSLLCGPDSTEQNLRVHEIAGRFLNVLQPEDPTEEDVREATS